MNTDYRRRVYAPWIDLASGSMGGVACVLAGQPFDTVKTRLQVNPELYRTVPTCVKKTLLEGGIRTFYYGSLPALLTHTTENAALFVFYNKCQGLVKKIAGVRSAKDLNVYQRGISGSLASIFTSLVIGPLEMLKCRLQINHNRNLLQVIRHIHVEDGITGYWRGLTSTWAREIPGYFSFFLTYEAAKKTLARPTQSVDELENYKVILAGGLAGCGFWIVGYPVDSVKSRIQVKATDTGSLARVVVQMLRTEGIGSFYKGLSTALIRSFPANAALFLAYEATKRHLERLALFSPDL